MRFIPFMTHFYSDQTLEIKKSNNTLAQIRFIGDQFQLN